MSEYKHRVRKKKMIKELELRYLGIQALFGERYGWGISGDVTRETYWSERYHGIVAIFRTLPCPILFKNANDNCWNSYITFEDYGQTLNDLYLYRYII